MEGKPKILLDFVRSVLYSPSEVDQRALMETWPALQAQAYKGKPSEKLIGLLIGCYVELLDKLQKSQRLSVVGSPIGVLDMVKPPSPSPLGEEIRKASLATSPRLGEENRRGSLALIGDQASRLSPGVTKLDPGGTMRRNLRTGSAIDPLPRSRSGSFLHVDHAAEVDLNKKKTNLLAFLNLGLSEKLLDNESKDIFRIITIMKKNGENQGIINALNLGLLRFDVDPALGRRSISAKTVSEISTVDQRKDSTRGKDAPSSSRSHFDSTYEDVIEIPYKDLALYITQVFADILRHVSIHEFIYMAIHGKCDAAFTPNLGRLVEEFTRLSYMIPTDILTKRRNNDERKTYIRYMIRVANELLELGNFHGVFAVVAGLNHISVQRLKKLWKKDSTNKKDLDKLEVVIDPHKNFAIYRDLLRRSTRAVPYTGLVVSDIIHLLENQLIGETEINKKVYASLVSVIDGYVMIKKDYGVLTIPTRNSIETLVKSIVICTSGDILDDYSYSIENSSSRVKAPLAPARTATYMVGFNTSVVPPERISAAEEMATIEKEKAVVPPPPKSALRTSTKISPLNMSHTELNVTEPHLSSRRPVRHLSLTIDPADPNLIRNISKKKFKSLSLINDELDAFDRIKGVCVELWEIKHILRWLDSLGLKEYGPAFEKNEMVGAYLPMLTETRLEKLGVTKLGHQLKILASIGGLKSLKKE